MTTMFLATSLLESLNPFEPLLLDSTHALRWVNLLCALGIPLAFWSGWAHGTAALRGYTGGELRPARIVQGLLWLACIVSIVSVSYRWIEVNHFPSQTMSEVLVMFSTALLLAMVVLQPALGLRRHHGHAWATVDDAILLVVFAGAWMTNHYSSTLSTAQRDLPPALQSYWFAPHLVSLIFSYASLAIAATIATVFFALRFWVQLRATSVGRSPVQSTAVFAGFGSVAVVLLGVRSGADWMPNLNWFWVLLGAGTVLSVVLGTVARRPGAAMLVSTATWMACLPFGHFVTLPLMLIVGVVIAVLGRHGKVPSPERMAAFESTLDQVSFRAFAVGFPFLTAGLFQGAFWAQEAWANYWGWDSKENTALISWLIYVLYVHVRLLGGYRGAKSMGVLVAGALSIFITFQIFGYLPDSQKSMHRYTDDGVVPREGMQGSAPASSARAEGAAAGPSEDVR